MRKHLDGRPKDTIYALSTASGKAGLAVFRISGPHAGVTFLSLSQRARLPEPRKATRCRLVDPESGEVIDDAIGIMYPTPASFTGEDVVELHVHGGSATISALASALSDSAGLRIAAPGEFLKRAFYSGKIDLTGAEAVADLVDADTAEQRKQALDQMGGGLSGKLEMWRTDIIELQAKVEAGIDFPDEEIPTELHDLAVSGIKRLAADIREYLDDSRRGEILRDGFKVGILGAPNAGKSTILNALVDREVAIVSEHAGTTRDVVEARIDIGGWPVVFFDTAGLRKTNDAVESEGVRRALEVSKGVELRLAVFDASAPIDKATLNELSTKNTIIVANKIDKTCKPVEWPSDTKVVAISAKTGKGLKELVSVLNSYIAKRFEIGTRKNFVTRARHREALNESLAALVRASEVTAAELFAEDLRLAARSLGTVTGRVDVEDILDRIFSEFCIGK
ncbi:MAG: tRNA uridine-5-carboxymethylaminomethyl(34) synthesis GTPase MnmE [Pseudomonadota bacterium]|nr:tRNA uridine-5-carboxymethylaminomethyl(34) synthesis GTPase MnmE [Pseudomonadota bacterium]